MLAAALAAGLGSFALGETDLLRVAIVIVVVCGLTWLCALLLPARLRTDYRTDPPEASVDSTIRIRVQTRAVRPMMPATAICHLPVTPGLDRTSHLAVPGARLRRGIRLDFSTAVLQRGLHPIGPLGVTMRDPLGLVSTSYLAPERTTVLGLPRRHQVNAAWLQTIGVLPLAPSSATQEGVESEPDVGVREHRPEDGLRRIHWRTSARTGRLMTRLDRPESDRVAVIAFESRATMHHPSTFEQTLEIVASLGVALLRRGWDLRLVDSSGERRAPGGGWEGASLLRFLALAEPVERGSVPPLPHDRTPVVLVTTDATTHPPQLVAQTILVPLPGSRATAAIPGVDALSDDLTVADLLGAPPLAKATA